jgi:imidazoleglycerol-phosphate dehydratase / histidinol-phosphatase
MYKKVIFLDRDGTLIDEPEDNQVDQLAKLKLKKNVIPALLQLKNAGYSLVMVSNQDGLGTESFRQVDFDLPHQLLLNIFQTQGIHFDAVHICPHTEADRCPCRKPQIGLLLNYLIMRKVDLINSYVIGDRETDLQLAKNLGAKGIFYNETSDWLEIASNILTQPRYAQVERKTTETYVKVTVNLDRQGKISVNTGIKFFDHMLEQLAKHAGFNLQLNVQGDLAVDEHHTVEDTAIALGEALRTALGDKWGINRYGFVLPMDEASAEVAIDLSGRSFFIFEGQFSRETVGELPTELVPHFFRSLSESLAAAIHIKVHGENCHHMIESIFKSVGRTLRQAVRNSDNELPSTKGVL